jgi:dienelactone hydrolase
MKRFLVASVCIIAAVVAQQQPEKRTYTPSADELRAIRAKRNELAAALQRVQAADDLRADVEIYVKAADFILRHPEEFYTKVYYDNTLNVLDTGLARAADLAKGQSPWTTRKGRLSRAYRSRVDGSLQPYGVLIPETYDAARPTRLDVVLHGRAATMNEVSFLFAHDSPKPLPPEVNHLQLEVYGRTNNAYRWAGETDVFEALASVQKRYNIDTNRIVLRGFSMGGAGTWHVGLHYPDRWVAIEAGAGFVDTKNYAKQVNLPEYQDRALHIYDAVDYAENAVNLPVVGYGGEVDPQLRASQEIQKAVASMTGLKALFLVGPKTPHRWHPDSLKESNAFIDAAVREGLRTPEKIRFVTYTTRYNRCFWVTIDALERHYERAEVEGTRAELKTRNIASLTLNDAGTPTIDGQKMRQGTRFEKIDGKWRVAKTPAVRKHHGLQGPIDDAFMESFVVVNPPDTFAREWAKWMRGDLRVKQAEGITTQDMADSNIVLFGDPDNSMLIRKMNSKLPIRWVAGEIVAGDQRFSAADHTVALVCPNPLNPSRYVVVNSGHTFGEKEFRGTNALLYPRLGDWAVLKKSDRTVVAAGLFDETWHLPGSGKHLAGAGGR